MSVVDSVRGMDEARETLEAYGIEWEFGDIALGDIDLARSLMWNAREDGTGLNDYWVDTYSLAYRNKEELPPIICMKAGPRSDKLLVLSGHHRVAGATKAGRKSLLGFTTDTLSDPQRLYVTAESNRKVGYGMSEEARIEAAKHRISLPPSDELSSHRRRIKQRSRPGYRHRPHRSPRLDRSPGPRTPA